tara:strand:+ start:194 stop:1609 length:1416 start_codon:yes stop_codon:yes gene_type:complete
VTEVFWNKFTAEAATLGQSKSFWEASGISYDTRKINKGDLFIALPGKRDGHDFVKAAFDNGATAAMVSKIPKGFNENDKLLVVDDVMKALVRMAKTARNRSKAIFIGITGTSGKTSTKDMGGLVFERFGKTHFSEKSYNNILGCSLTLATIPIDTEYVLVEIGTNNLGEIAELSKIVKPDYVVITDVSIGHMEGLKSLDNIVQEKASICLGQKHMGTAILPSDIEKFNQLKAKVEDFGSKVISFGEDESSDLRISNIEVLRDVITSTILDQEQNLWNIKLKTAGKHYMKNAAGLLALVASLKLNSSKAISALQNWSPLAGRGQVLEIKLKDGNYNISIKLIDESYNANPGSVKSSLETLACIFTNKKNKCKHCRRIAVLGDMLELGLSEVQEHVNISKFARLDKIDKIYCVGPRMRKLFDVLPSSKRGFWTETAQEMQHVLVNKLENGDIVMIKGSFSMGMNTIVNKLKDT